MLRTEQNQVALVDYDPRIIALYDTDNPDGPDHDYFRALATEVKAEKILDLGCGTGLLTVTFAGPQRTVVGIDPSPVMMDYARQRPGAERVTWIEGDASAIPAGTFDLLVMTGNVAQHIPEPHWAHTLHRLRDAAAKGAVLAFESRNPLTRAWETWNEEKPETRQTPFGPLTEWCDTEESAPGRVRLLSYARLERSQEVLVEELNLAFRSYEQIRAQLAEAGFEVRAVYSDWKGTEFSADKPLMVFEAVAV